MNENDQALEDRDWWREFAARFRWRLLGWTSRNRAIFILKSGDTLTLTAEARQDVERVLFGGV